MDYKWKKMIAPIIITIFFIAYFIFYFAVIITMFPSIAMKLLFGMIPLALAGVLIYVCIQRINEIRSEEEDDLSQY